MATDAGASTDAGSDAGFPSDAGADAGTGDSGITDAGSSSDAGAQDGGTSNDLCFRPSFGSGFAITQVNPRRANQGRFSVPPFQVNSVFPRSPTRLDVFFSRATEQPTLTDFSLTPMLGVVGISDGGTTLVTISTDQQLPGRAYVLNVSGVRAASDQRVFPTAQLAFTGYQSSFKAIAAGPSATAREVALIFSEPVPCTALVPASFSIPGRQVLAVTFFGACSSSTQSARLRLDRTLPPGQHVVTASPAVVTLAGQPLELRTATTQGPSTTSARSVFGISTDQPTSLTVTFDEPVGTEALDAGVYSFTPPLSVLAVAPIANTTNVRLTTQPLTANTIYTLTVAGPAGALPPARFWGHDSFFVSQAFSARLHQAQVFYSLPVSASAQNTSLYTFTPALTASATSAGTGATFTLANDTDGLDVTFDVVGVTSSLGRMLASGHGGWVDLVLSRPMNAALTPKVLLEGVDLSVNGEVLVSNDGRTLSVATGPLPSGRWQLTVCGLEDATGSARLGPMMVEAVVP